MDQTQRGFSIVLMEEYAIELFGTAIHISRLASVDQNNCKLWLIYNSSEDPDDITLSVNASTEKKLAPKAMNFGACLDRLLQRIRESNPADGPIWISKWGISDAFHRCNMCLSDIVKFTYVMPPLPS